ncbi:MAG: iron ABC transporter substrate-binding protein [Dehalococcoidia bacterium]
MALPLLAACGGDDADITVYSGRTEQLIQPIIDRFEEESGLKVDVKYGSTSEMAALLAEEGEDSPADVFLAQDAGALGAVSDQGLLGQLPDSLLSKVEPRFRAGNGQWVGLSGRARVLVYNPDLVPESELPSTVEELTDPKWKDRTGWSPPNGSFQAFVTAFRVDSGEEATSEWLQAMKANGVKDYPNNITILDAVAAGEIEVGLVNHYYLYEKLDDQGEGYKARNHFLDGDDIGALVNVAGIALLAGSDHKEDATALLEFLLAEEAQHYFAEETFEYPLAAGVAADPRLVPLTEIESPDIDLSELDDLEGTLDLLRANGVLP